MVSIVANSPACPQQGNGWKLGMQWRQAWSGNARARTQTFPDPQRFNLESFAAILPDREPIVGEDPASWEALSAGLRQALNPKTPYEAVIAENLIAIEWELLQHRSMRDAAIRKTIRRAIRRAAANAGAVPEFATDLADRAVSTDEAVRNYACQQIQELGMEPVELMGEAYRGALVGRRPDPLPAAAADIPGYSMPVESEDLQPDNSAEHHDEKIRQLERRRREVKRDYDQLQQSRPDEGAIIEQ